MKQIITWVVVALVVVGGFFWYATTNRAPAVPNKYDDFAQCTAKAGITMYGAVWCPHCQNQKKEFGTAFKYVNYIECPDNIKLCTDKGVTGYPTWITGDGQKLVGEQSLEKLAEVTKCQLPK